MMAARLFALLSILGFAAAATLAAQPAGLAYWNKVLPSTPVPNAIKNLLISDDISDNKSGTAVNVGKGGVAVNTGKPKPGGTSVGVNTGKGTSVNVGGHGGGVGVRTGKGTSVNVGHGGVGVDTGKGKPGGTRVNAGKGGVGVIVNPPKKKSGAKISPFIYRYAAIENQLRDDPHMALFFLEKDLKPGYRMTLHFTPTTPAAAAFISRREADSIPFTSTKIPQILDRLSIHPDSDEAESMKQTLSECEEPAMKGESKRCTTSLESMVEFATTSLGTRNVAAVSTTVDRHNSPKQQYTITSKRLSGSNLMVCHAETYAYAVFYCHTTRTTKAYQVEMVGEDGTKVEAVAVCHADTAGWNPKHVAFRVLGVKPGTVPVCHFLPEDHLVWSPKKV